MDFRKKKFLFAIGAGCVLLIIIVSVSVSVSNNSSSNDVPNNIIGSPADKFNLQYWKLQLPVAKGSSVQEIQAISLVSGYKSKYFYLSDNQAMTFWVPSDGGKTPNSNNPRSELREMQATGNWKFSGTHIMTAIFTVDELPDTAEGIIVGQIHGNDETLNPEVCKIFWLLDNSIIVQFKNNYNPDYPQVTHSYGKFRLKEKIQYVIMMVNTKLSVSVTNIENPNPTTVTFFTNYDNTYWNQQSYYFKAGNYFLINSPLPVTSTLVKFYKLNVTHS
jgi:hypothetical protein